MSQQHAAIWKQAAEAFDQRYQAVTDAQWDASTPCEEWTVRELVDHAVGVQAGFAVPMVGADLPEGADWPAVNAAVTAALEDPSVLEGTTQTEVMGEVPKTVMFGIGASDLLIHAWDLARAIGADETLPAEAVSAAYAGLQRFPTEMMRAPGRFGPAVDAADDADEQTKMLSFAGRTV